MNTTDQYKQILKFCRHPNKYKLDNVDYQYLYWFKHILIITIIKITNFRDKKLNMYEKVKIIKHKFDSDIEMFNSSIRHILSKDFKLLTKLNKVMLIKQIQNLPRDIKQYVLLDYIETPDEIVTNFGSRCWKSYKFRKVNIHSESITTKNCFSYCIQNMDKWIYSLYENLPETITRNNIQYKKYTMIIKFDDSDMFEIMLSQITFINDEQLKKVLKYNKQILKGKTELKGIFSVIYINNLSNNPIILNISEKIPEINNIFTKGNESRTFSFANFFRYQINFHLKN